MVQDDDDSPATGTVTVTGTATEGETLAADASGIADADGLAGASYAYRWVRTPPGGGNADVSGATAQTYAPVFADVGATLRVRVTVTDDEGHRATFTSAPTAAVAALPRPSVTVASDGDVTEGSPALFTLTRAGDTAQALDVDYEITATGDFGATTGAGTATFPANSATAQVSVGTTGDGVHEAHGSVALALAEDTGDDPAYLRGTPSEATAAVGDDDDSPATGSVTITTATTFTEGETLTADTSGLADADGLADAVYAYQWVRTPPGGGDANIPGATSKTYVPVFADAGATLKVKVTVTDDEGHEATFTSAPTPAVAPAPRPTVSVERTESPVEEGESARFTVTRTGVTTGALAVLYRVDETGAMVRPGDEGAKTLDLPDGTASATVAVPTVPDGIHERDSTVTLTLTADAAYELGAQRSAEVTAEDDDNAAPTGAPTIDDETPVVGETLAADASSLDDPDGLTNRRFTWRWLRVSGGTETEIAGATAASYTVAAGDAGAALKVRAGFTDDDGTAETVESAPTSAVESPPPVLTVAAETGTVTEGEDAVFLLTRTGALSGELPVTFEVTGGDAVLSDTAPATATFGADADTARVTLATGDDGTGETNAALTLTLTDGDAYDLGTPSVATVTVTDHTTPAASIADAPAVTEGETLAFPVRLSHPSATQVTVAYELTTTVPHWWKSEVATTTRVAGTVTFAAGQMQRTIRRATEDDDAQTRNAAVEVVLQAGDTHELGAPSTASSTIRDNDPPRVRIGAHLDGVADVVVEGEEARIDLRREGNVWVPLEVLFTIEDAQGALASEAPASTEFRAGEDVATVRLDTRADAVDGPGSESTVTLRLQPAATYRLGIPSEAGVTVQDDGPPGTSQAKAADTVVTLAAESGSVAEGEEAVFVLLRAGGASSPLTVAVEVGETGSVLAGPAPAEVTFGAGEAQARLRVATEDDSTAEADGRVTATVTAGPGYTAESGAGSAGVDVLDNDAPATPEETVTLWSATMTVADLGGSAGASGARLADPGWSEDGVEYALELLRRLGPPAGLVEARFDRRPPRTEELTLHAGELTLALAEGGSGQTFVWPVEGEPWPAGTEVALRLTRAVKGEDSDGTASAGISVADARVHESAGTPLAFRVTLGEARTSAVSVRYATSDGSATAGADYVAASGVVRFEAGETEKTVHVAVLEDAHDEGEETMTLTLSHPFGAEVSDGVATGTVANTDAMPRAWLGRFGRTVAGQVVDAVEARMTAVRQAGAEVSIAGPACRSGRNVRRDGAPRRRRRGRAPGGVVRGRSRSGGAGGERPRAAGQDVVRADGGDGGERVRLAVGARRGDGLRRPGRRALGGRGGGDGSAGGRLGAGRLGGGSDGGSQPGQGQLQRWPGRRHGLVVVDRTVPLGPAGAERPGDGVGGCGLRRGDAGAGARGSGPNRDRHGPRDGGGGAARRAGGGAGGRWPRAGGEDGRAVRAHRFGGGTGQRRRDAGGGRRRSDAAAAGSGGHARVPLGGRGDGDALVRARGAPRRGRCGDRARCGGGRRPRLRRPVLGDDGGPAGSRASRP